MLMFASRIFKSLNSSWSCVSCTEKEIVDADLVELIDVTSGIGVGFV